MKLEQIVSDNYGALMTVKQPIMFVKNKKGWSIKLKPKQKEIDKSEGVYFSNGIPEGIDKIPAIVNHILIINLYNKYSEMRIILNKLTNPTKKV